MECPYCKGTGECEGSFAARVRAARDNAGMTQAEAAQGLGIGRAQLANIEAGRSQPTVDVLANAAEKFGTTTDWLLGRE